jgi:hypothetical protein
MKEETGMHEMKIARETKGELGREKNSQKIISELRKKKECIEEEEQRNEEEEKNKQ